MLEFGVIAVEITCDRGISHEIVRHRLASYAQQSTRYCDEGSEKKFGGVNFIEPFFFDEYDDASDDDRKDIQLPHPIPVTCISVGSKAPKITPWHFVNADKGSKHSMTAWDVWFISCLWSEWAYNTLRNEFGAKPQEARAVLPNCLRTVIGMQASIREWRHVLKLRCHKDAHPQIRQVMIPLLKFFQKELLVLFEDIEYDDTYKGEKIPLPEVEVVEVYDEFIYSNTKAAAYCEIHDPRPYEEPYCDDAEEEEDTDDEDISKEEVKLHEKQKLRCVEIECPWLDEIGCRNPDGAECPIRKNFIIATVGIKADEPTANGDIYPREVVEKMVNDVKDKTILLYPSQPLGVSEDSQEAIGEVEKLEINNNNELIMNCKILKHKDDFPISKLIEDGLVKVVPSGVGKFEVDSQIVEEFQITSFGVVETQPMKEMAPIPKDTVKKVIDYLQGIAGSRKASLGDHQSYDALLPVKQTDGLLDELKQILED